MKRISCLMLDMGGVLTQDHRQDKVDELMRILGTGCPRGAFLEAYFAERSDYDRGLVRGEEYWRRIGRSLGALPREEDLEDLVRVDLESWFNMRERMMEFLRAARERVARVVLLSNIHHDGARYLREGPGRAWCASFHELVLSCEHGLLKPELEIYELAMDAAGVLPSEALFVDDVQANVDGALRAGMASFRFTGEAEFEAVLERDFELVR